MARYNETRNSAESENNKLLDLIYSRFRLRLKREFKRAYCEVYNAYDKSGNVPDSVFKLHEKNITDILEKTIYRSMVAGSLRILQTFKKSGWISAVQVTDTQNEKRQVFAIQARNEAKTEARFIAETTKKETMADIKRVMEKKGLIGDMIRDLMKKAEERSIFRTVAVGFTNIHGALNFGQQSAVRSTTDDDYNHYKIWVTAKDERVRAIPKGAKFDHVEMDGAEVLENEKFSIPGGALADMPGDRNTPVGNFINCRCFLQHRRELKA